MEYFMSYLLRSSAQREKTNSYQSITSTLLLACSVTLEKQNNLFPLNNTSVEPVSDIIFTNVYNKTCAHISLIDATNLSFHWVRVVMDRTPVTADDIK